MSDQKIAMGPVKKIALVAHDLGNATRKLRADPHRLCGLDSSGDGQHARHVFDANHDHHCFRGPTNDSYDLHDSDRDAEGHQNAGDPTTESPARVG